ncbi:GFA family protein [uncultured Paraglaciecola sp.]|uniref:GFA family protein n=1 Tax=uncultured Paraglaciecola sp. TaxID=1765024 RepID=UPI002611A0E7|nr:GFA family protein [uncultured Paraglaciecola sp.]
MIGTTRTSARCECGVLTLRINEAPVVQLVCHCSDCRVFTAMPYTALAFFQPDRCSAHGQNYSTVMKGGTGSDKTHHSCASCQTPLYVTVAALNGALAVIAKQISTFKFEPQVHIWTSEKAVGVTIPPGVTQSSGVPPKQIAGKMVSSFWGGK